MQGVKVAKLSNSRNVACLLTETLDVVVTRLTVTVTIVDDAYDG
jgi:hypothetical protein